MNNFLLGLIFLCISVPNPIIKNKPVKKSTIIEKDLFSDPEYIKAYWLGNIQSTKTNKYISNLPMFIYRNAQSAYAKIICIPSRLDNWDAKFKGKSALQKTSITKVLTKGIIGHSFNEKQFNIYAFLLQSNEKKNQFDKNYNVTAYPATIYIYKNIGTKWISIAEKTVSNRLAYQQLQFDIATSSL